MRKNPPKSSSLNISHMIKSAQDNAFKNSAIPISNFRYLFLLNNHYKFQQRKDWITKEMQIFANSNGYSEEGQY